VGAAKLRAMKEKSQIEAMREAVRGDIERSRARRGESPFGEPESRPPAGTPGSELVPEPEAKAPEPEPEPQAVAEAPEPEVIADPPQAQPVQQAPEPVPEPEPEPERAAVDAQEAETRDQPRRSLIARLLKRG
jgi:hypothetical protein